MPLSIVRPKSPEKAAETVDFEYCQMDKVVKAHEEDRPVEFESITPYLQDYVDQGKMTESELQKSEQIGLAVAKRLRKLLPKARMISIYDDYNVEAETENEAIKDIRDSYKELLAQKGLIESESDHLLISEGEKAVDWSAAELVRQLQEQGKIRFKKRGEIEYITDDPNMQNVTLRGQTKKGVEAKWRCPALDASTYLNPENLDITHLIILPSRFENQQHAVFSMLNDLGIQPENYHNIFFDKEERPEDVAQEIENKITEEYQKAGYSIAA